jgi:mannose-1-phosphate guanylyltransferase
MSFLGAENIFIASNEEYREEVKKFSKNIPEENLIFEPDCRDTAPSIAFSATILEKKSRPDEVMCVIYADHLLQNPEIFIEKLKIAANYAAEKSTLNIIEVKAKFPNTNLGYVKIGPEIENIENHAIHSFEKFVEKPDFETAQKFLADGSYLWNTGFYIWKIKDIIEQFRIHAPEIHKAMQEIKKLLDQKNSNSQIKTIFQSCPKISIDYAIMEKADPSLVRIFPADIKWSDIGTWSSIHDELTRDHHENIIRGEHIGTETEGCLIYAKNSKPIITIGLKDTIIVDTPEATLICPKSRSHELKNIIDEIKQRKPEIL